MLPRTPLKIPAVRVKLLKNHHDKQSPTSSSSLPSPASNVQPTSSSPSRPGHEVQIAGPKNNKLESGSVGARSLLSIPFASSVRPSDLLNPVTPSATATTVPAKRFELGQEVFILDRDGNSVLCSRAISPTTVANTVKFDAAALEEMESISPVHYDGPNIFLVLRCIAKRCTPKKADNYTSGENTMYHLVPKDGNGRQRLSPSGKMMVEVRFRPGDWAWYLHRRSGIDGTIIKLKALVIGAEVLHMKRVYHISVVHHGCDRILVSDERLEEVVSGIDA
ncbi:uncharacterized protein A1O5_01214 [Cladophialophora psammophila CBS 110553]|uniref:Uncharacterized protein n=1 Tax=Cladophialophora psammophila CBS 110553 TaxID=1182543 RepID=W9XIC2_9EURO|nr:uncharacterized protein A1O5_01214 [Cladophialophora psammophila CBS 110553]EXJ76706.1 hypothetical protein A1O5_01214 [Cladophialophora psammophila CBS 110553]